MCVSMFPAQIANSFSVSGNHTFFVPFSFLFLFFFRKQQTFLVHFAPFRADRSALFYFVIYMILDCTLWFPVFTLFASSFAAYQLSFDHRGHFAPWCYMNSHFPGFLCVYACFMLFHIFSSLCCSHRVAIHSLLLQNCLRTM